MHILELKILPHQYSIHKLLPKHELPDLLYRKNSFFSFTSTDEETSLICESSFDIKDSVRDDRWSCIKLVGQLNVEETGIWSRITSACSNCDCAVLTVTTFNTALVDGHLKEAPLGWTLLEKQYATIDRAPTEIEEVKASLLNGGADLGAGHPKGLSKHPVAKL